MWNLKLSVSELQDINYLLLWGGQDAHPVHRAGKMPTPQEFMGYFFVVLYNKSDLLKNWGFEQQ